MKALSPKYPLYILCLFLLLLQGYATNLEKKRYFRNVTFYSANKVVKSTVSKIKQVPVLCYHNIKEISKNDGPKQKAYSISPDNFAWQIKALSDNGYTSITPDELKDYLNLQRSLPKNPIVITFDDGTKGQYEIGAGILDKYNFKGVFFIMTVAIGKKNYMNQNQIKSLSDKGHIIGCHTWDHHKVTDFKKEDWLLQIVKPKKELEKITQKPVTSFAYPYGAWNLTAADSLRKYGFTAAFIFYGRQDSSVPLYSIERISVTNSLKTENFLAVIKKKETQYICY
jgi:peptidoglycan/xylan/chitin deacetylase (PgdA/CDA1 family)